MEKSKTWISYIILGLSITFLIIITSIVLCNLKGTPEKQKDLLLVIIPLISTWVGTILAFYFGRENYESANRNYLSLTDKMMTKDVNFTVEEAMLDIKSMTYYKLTKKIDEVPVKEILDSFGGKTRLPVIDENFKPLYILHFKDIDTFYKTEGNSDKKLGDFFENDEALYQKNGKKGFIIVSKNTTLKDLLNSMVSINKCRDAFVTEGGDEKSALTGWITEDRLIKLLN